MKAIIIGAGIGGPVVAAALQKAGVEAVVCEAHDGPAEFLGLFLGIGVNGMRVLRELNMLDEVLRQDFVATPNLVFSSTTGRQLGSVSNGWLDSDIPSISITRGALQKGLIDAARASGVAFKYGKRMVQFHDTGRDVIVRFQDGSEERGDVLIGADGIWSKVRTLLDPNARRPEYTGLLSLGGFVSRTDLAPTPNTMHMVWGRRAFFGYTIRTNGQAWWFANLGTEDEPARGALASIGQTEWKQQLFGLFADDPAFINQLIEQSDEIGAVPIHDVRSVAAWRRGRVGLLGDAAHAVSPSAGQGASMAMEDGIVVAKCIRDLGNVEAALTRYEQLRRPRAEKIVAEGRRRGKYKAPRTRTTLWLRDMLMPVMMRLFANDRANAWIYNYDVPWEDRVPDAA